jgi:hypothetical protein
VQQTNKQAVIVCPSWSEDDLMGPKLLALEVAGEARGPFLHHALPIAMGSNPISK